MLVQYNEDLVYHEICLNIIATISYNYNFNTNWNYLIN